MHNIRLNSNLERTIARSEELEEQIGDITFEKLFQPASRRLASHRETGKHKITQTKGTVDHFVNLEGVAAMAVEVGHHNHRDGEFVPGIHVLGTTLFGAEVSHGGD
jgi:hypothetical protein